MLFIDKGELNVLDGAFVVVDANGVRTHIPVGGLACLMLEPGARISHAAVTLAARVGCLILWVGEAGVRLYASGQPGGARSDRLLFQARLALDDGDRLTVVRKMYALRFKEEPPARRSVDQLRGIEGPGARDVPHPGPALRRSLERAAVRGRRFRCGRPSQPLPQPGDELPVWRD
ncbi:hypothetical protein [Hankyongella ginsenosidimutans]|uniref:hypothetical protein n=1 Tax=Hankyongella ginsenosidimutans TaxID=1763828 RepID=UPI001FEB4EAA|nr:hypothetical protein [Hankyongella ginsenosidimutans]